MRQSSRLAWLSVCAWLVGLWAVPTLAQVRVECPPGPFHCTPWGPPNPGTPPAPPPPGPWHPGPIVVIEPDAKLTDKALPELVRGTPGLAPMGTADKLKIQGLLGERVRYLDPGKSYYLPQDAGKGIVFKGLEVRP